MKTLTFTNDEIELLADAIDIIHDGALEGLHDDISHTIETMQPDTRDVATRVIMNAATRYAALASLRERMMTISQSIKD